MNLPKDVYLDSQNVTPINSNPELDKIKALSYEEIKFSNPEPLENILDPWLPLQGIGCIYAAAGVGKTFFTLNIAYTIASGGNFLSYSAKKPKRVLYIDGEMAYARMHARFMDIIKQQGELDEFTKNNFFLLTPDKFLPFRLPKIDTQEGQLFYNKKINENNIDVIVIDNLATLSVFNEGVPEEWQFIQDWFIDLRSRGKTIIFIHHAGKDKKGYRGTSRIIDCADTAISLQDVSSTEVEDSTIYSKKFKIEYQKNRTFYGKDALSFEVTFNSKGWESQSMENNNTIRILEMFNNLQMKQVNIARELGLSESYVSKIIRQHKVKNPRNLNQKI